MFQKLVSHNEDLQRLATKGYALAFDSNHLVVRDIPYLDQGKNLCWGAIVAKLEFVDSVRVRQNDHQVYFSGSVPHGLGGKPIPNLGGGAAAIRLSEASADVVVERSFSNKPRSGSFNDFFDKVESYVSIISGPAMELYNTSPLTFRVVENTFTDPIFKLHDTLTSRAEIGDLAAKLENDVVALIGLGGTGAYLLDFLVRTRVREIRGFDKDPYHVHNTYRSPGAVAEKELGATKADVYQSRYDNFRHGLVLKDKFIDATCAKDLGGVTFAFVCVDKGSSRAGIFDLLISLEIPFIDVGMGLNRKHGALNGLLRTTYYSADVAQQLRDKGLAELADRPDDIYHSNIQISELNALNACLAIIRFKQLRGYYFEENPLQHMLFEVGDLKVVGETVAAP